MYTVVTKKDDSNNPTNVTKILKPISPRKDTSVGQFSKKEYLGGNAKTLDSKWNLLLTISTRA